MKIYNELLLAKELMRFPSVTPVDAGTMNFLAKKLRSLGFKCKILEFKSKNSKPVKNLYAKLGKNRPNFCSESWPTEPANHPVGDRISSKILSQDNSRGSGNIESSRIPSWCWLSVSSGVLLQFSVVARCLCRVRNQR